MTTSADRAYAIDVADRIAGRHDGSEIRLPCRESLVELLAAAFKAGAVHERDQRARGDSFDFRGLAGDV